MKVENWLVTPENGPRPAGPPDRCFYCGAAIGSQHAESCVIRKRTVVVRATVEYVVTVPEDWDAHMIEFHRNDGSWCAGNGLSEIGRLAEYLDRDDAPECGCSLATWEYVREASPEDEHACGVYVRATQNG